MAHLPGSKGVILEILDDRPREAFTTYQIWKLSGLNYGTIRKAISRLARDQRIRKISYGLYQSLKSLIHPELPDPNLRLHGLKLEYRWHTNLRGSYRKLSQIVSGPWFPRFTIHPINRSKSVRREWNGRRQTITLHRPHVRLLEVWLTASRLPLNLVEIVSYLDSVSTFFQIPQELLRVKQADWNNDVLGSLAEDYGLTSMSVATFRKWILKVYQLTAEKARIEVRSFEDLNAHVISDYFRDMLLTLQDLREEEHE